MIQNITQIIAQVLFFWRRGAEDGVEAAFSLDEQDQAGQGCARAAGHKVVSSFRERRGGKGKRRPHLEQLVQAARDGNVDVVYVYDGARSPRELLTDRRDECCGPSRRCSATEQITERADSALPVAIYCRNATRNPEDSNLDAQVAACVEQAEADGERVDPLYVYREWGSGLNFDRALLSSLRAAVQAGKVRAVYVRSPDRLSRSYPHLALLVEEFASAGVELRCVQRAVGKADSHGRAPYGYDRHYRQEPDEEDGAEAVQPGTLMLELAKAGWHPSRIAAHLNRMELPSESRAEWDASNFRRILEKWANT